MLYVVFFSIICLALIGVTIAGKDFWPFSHYPMFSIEQKIEDVKVLRIALEDSDGKIVWWHSKFFRYPEFTGRKLQKIYGLNIGGKKLDAFINIERNKLLKAVMIHVEEEQPERSYSAIHIIERKITGSFKVSDKTIDIVQLEQLKLGSIQ